MNGAFVHLRSTKAPFIETLGADASYSGAPGTVPAAMVDGNASTYWSNYYLKRATGLLPAVSRAHAKDWVSLPTGSDLVGSVQATFLTDTSHALPSAIAVSYWNGTKFVPARDVQVAWGSPVSITFAPVRTDRIRLELTSSAPGTTHGFLGISQASVGR